MIRNAHSLGVDLKKITHIVLSHGPVSYTHLDVYKRQVYQHLILYVVRVQTKSLFGVLEGNHIIAKP